MRFSIANLLQRLRQVLEPAANDGPETLPVQPQEVEQAVEDRLTVTEGERVAAAKAAREAMERIRRERGGDSECN
jgi:hypothetical protein